MLVAPGVGHHVYSVMDASTRGVVKHFEENESHLRRSDVIIPLEQVEGDQGQCSLLMGPGWSTASEDNNSGDDEVTGSVVMAVTADIWNRKMGHAHGKLLEKLRNTMGTGVNVHGDFPAAVSVLSARASSKIIPRRPTSPSLRLSAWGAKGRQVWLQVR